MDSQQIVKILKQLADPQDSLHLQRYFKTGPGEYGEGDRFYGIRVPVLRKLSKQYRAIILSEIEKLLHSPMHEARLLALLILVEQYQKGGQREKDQIYKYYLANTTYINNWDLVDSSAHKIVGAMLFDKERKPLYKLVKSNNLWERRIAIMATFYFIKQNDFLETLTIAEKLLSDQHDLIHKAVGWMLREVGNRDRVVEETFLKQHYQNMPRTMLRYAVEKFPEKRRKDYLQGKI